MPLDNVPRYAALILTFTAEDGDGPNLPKITLSEIARVLYGNTVTVGNVATKTIAVETNQSGIASFEVYVGDGLNQATYVVTYTVTNEVATPTPMPLKTPTPMATPSPTKTPTPTATPIPINIPYGKVIVMDDAVAVEPLNYLDADSSNNRALTVRWNFPNAVPMKNVNVYVSTNGAAQDVYIGQTGSGTATQFNWMPIGLQPGPQFDNVYRFSIYILKPDHAKGNPSFFGPFYAEPLWYIEEGTAPQAPAGMEIKAGSAIMTDNLASFKDISGATDDDTEVIVRWNLTDISQVPLMSHPATFDIQSATLTDVHVWGRVNGVTDVFFGNPGNGLINFLRVDNNTPLTNNSGMVQRGIKFGESYGPFRVYGRIRDALGNYAFVGPLITAGSVHLVAPLPTATPTPTVAPKPMPTPTPTATPVAAIFAPSPTPTVTSTPTPKLTPTPTGSG